MRWRKRKNEWGWINLSSILGDQTRELFNIDEALVRSYSVLRFYPSWSKDPIISFTSSSPEQSFSWVIGSGRRPNDCQLKYLVFLLLKLTSLIASEDSTDHFTWWITILKTNKSFQCIDISIYKVKKKVLMGCDQ